MSARLLIRLAIRFLLRAPNDGWTVIQRVIARRKIFDVAVVAGEYNGSRLKSICFNNVPNQPRQDLQKYVSAACMSCRVPDLVGDEIFVKRKPIFGDKIREHLCSFFRRSRLTSSPRSINSRIGEVMDRQRGPPLRSATCETEYPQLPPRQLSPRPIAVVRRRIAACRYSQK